MKNKTTTAVAEYRGKTMARSDLASFGFGIVDRDGSPWWDSDCVCDDEGLLREALHDLNDPRTGPDSRRPYRVVELFYAPPAEPQEERLAGLERALREYLAWSFETFPHSTPMSTAKHLRKEVDELLADPTNAEELVDVLALAVHLSARAGIDLAATLRAKLPILRARKWAAPDADGVVEHVREAEPQEAGEGRLAAGPPD